MLPPPMPPIPRLPNPFAISEYLLKHLFYDQIVVAFGQKGFQRVKFPIVRRRAGL